VAALYDPATDTVRVVRREASGRTVTLRRGSGDLFGKPTPPYLLDEETASRRGGILTLLSKREK